MDADREKKLAAEAAAELVQNGMRVGLGTGSTVAFLLTALSRRSLNARFVATSPRTERSARTLGLVVDEFDAWDRLDLAIDGADQIAPDGWLMKGRGGAHTREKVVAASAERFVVIADSTKPVAALHGPVPVELMKFGVISTLRRLGEAEVRGWDLSPDGGIIADVHCDLDDPRKTALMLASIPGVVDHGLFEPSLVTDVIIGGHEAVRPGKKGVRP